MLKLPRSMGKPAKRLVRLKRRPDLLSSAQKSERSLSGKLPQQMQTQVGSEMALTWLAQRLSLDVT
jgi:hypothetical protein